MINMLHNTLMYVTPCYITCICYVSCYITCNRQAGHLPPLNADDTSMFSTSECIIQDHVRKYKTKAAELKDLIQEVLHHPDFDVC